MGKSFLSLFIVLLLSFGQEVIAQTGTVIFKISNIEFSNGGVISTGLFSEETFPKVGQQLKGSVQTATANYMEIKVLDVPAGTYGAVAFHDIDQNRDLKTNFMGYPQEPIGFANGAKIRFGPPSFKEASIQINPGEVKVVYITLD